MNERYIRLVIVSVLMSGNICLYATPDGMYLLCVMRLLSEVMIAAVSSMALMASKIRWWTITGLILDSFFSGRISSVYRLVKRLLSTVAVVVWAMRRLQILVLVVPFSTPFWSIEGLKEPSACLSTIILGSTYVKIVF